MGPKIWKCGTRNQDKSSQQRCIELYIRPSFEKSNIQASTYKRKSPSPGSDCASWHTQQNVEGLLNGQGHCVSYGRTLIIEKLANAVVENTGQFQGLYVPPFLKKGAFFFFAADNTDFAEDTADGKGTTHGAVIAVYQKAGVPGELIAPPLAIGDAHSVLVTPYHVDMLLCDKPKPHQIQRTEDFTINEVRVSESYQMTQLGWRIASALSRMKDGGQSSKIPGWAGYNSLMYASQSVAQVGALPLLPEVAHEWSTLLTVIMQASQLRYLAVGVDHPTVILFDMALYEKVVQLIDARPDLKRTVVPKLANYM